ncbi:MAG: EpsG family protein [Candidatus Saccharimonadales bacterium]
MDSMVSLVFYLAMFSLAVALVYAGGKTKNKFLTFAGLAIPIVVAALRYKTGIDYSNYTNITNLLSKMSPNDFFSSPYSSIYEPTTYFITQIAYLLGGGDVLFFGIYAAIVMLPFYFAIKRIKPEATWIAVLLYLLIFFAPSLNGIRQYAAISITFCATIFLYYPKVQKSRYRLVKFVAAVLIATSIHSSAICALAIPVVYWISQKLANKTTSKLIIYHGLLIVVIFTMAYLAVKNIDSIPFLNRYSHYLGWAEEGMDINTPNLIPKIVPVLIATVFIGGLKKRDKKSVFYYTMTCIAFATSLLGFIIPYGYRLSDYFFVFQIPLLISIVANAKPANRKQIYMLILIAYGVVYFLYSSLLNNSHGIFPYQFIFLQ